MLIRKTLWTKSAEKQLRAVGRNWCWRSSLKGTQAFRINKQTLPTLLARGNVSLLFCQYSLHRIFLVSFIFICKPRESTAYARWKHLSSRLSSDARSSALLKQKIKVYFFQQFHYDAKVGCSPCCCFQLPHFKNLTQVLHLPPQNVAFFQVWWRKTTQRWKHVKMKQRNNPVPNFCLTETEHSIWEEILCPVSVTWVQWM